MNPLTIIYWTRVLLGVAAALICVLLNELIGGISIFNAISIALLVYIISYYLYKAKFQTRVEKTSKIFTTGVGAYFITWIVVFTLLFTLTGPTLTITGPPDGAIFSVGQTVTIVVQISNPFGTLYSGGNVTANIPNGTIIQLSAISPGVYSTTYNITQSDSASSNWNIKVQAVVGGRYREDSITVRMQTS